MALSRGLTGLGEVFEGAHVERNDSSDAGATTLDFNVDDGRSFYGDDE